MNNKVVRVGSLEEFKKLCEVHEHVVVDLSNEWSSACEIFSSVFQRLAETWYDDRRTVFATVDTEKLPEVADIYDVSVVPTVLVITDGRVTGCDHGNMTVAQLRSFLNDSIVSPMIRQ